MRDAKSEIERLKSDIRLLQGKLHKVTSRLGRLSQINPYQHMLVEADEDIQPNEEGTCSVVWRLGKTPGYDDRELKKRNSYKIKVYNHRKTPIWKDEQFHVAVDTWGDYYRLSESDRDGIVSFFLTPEDGIPAAEDNQCFSSNCLRHYFDVNTSEIKPLEDPDSGGFVFDDVFNHTYGPVEANTMIQAKKIDGAWFVDVEPCPPLEEEDG